MIVFMAILFTHGWRKNRTTLLFPDNQNSVPDRKYNLFDPLVVVHLFIEHYHPPCLGIFRCLIAFDLSPPQHVVSYYEPACTHLFKHQVIVFTVLTFIAVDEYKVKCIRHRGNDILGPACVKSNPVCHPCKGQVVGAHLAEFVVDRGGKDQ